MRVSAPRLPSVLQCVAVCCNELECVAGMQCVGVCWKFVRVCWNILQWSVFDFVAICWVCKTLKLTVTPCTKLQHTATHGNTLLHTATHCTTPQHTAPHCTTLQHTAHHTATHCKTLQHAITCSIDAIDPAFPPFSTPFAEAAIWDMTHQHVRQGPFMYVTWLIHMGDMTHSHVCDMTHSYVWHDSFDLYTDSVNVCPEVRDLTWLIHMCDMTHPMCRQNRSYVRHDSFNVYTGSFMERVTWLMCDMTHVWHESFNV